MTELKAPAMDARFDIRLSANRMRAAADALLSNLTRDQLAKAMFPFENEDERRDWDFIPKYRRNGLPLREMNERQQVLAQQLLASGLSLDGLRPGRLDHELRERAARAEQGPHGPRRPASCATPASTCSASSASRTPSRPGAGAWSATTCRSTSPSSAASTSRTRRCCSAPSRPSSASSSR